MSFKDKLRWVTPKTSLRIRGICTHVCLSLNTRGTMLFPKDWKKPDFIVKRQFYWRTYAVRDKYGEWEETVRVFPRMRKARWLLQPIPVGHPPCLRSLRARRAAARRALRGRGMSSPPM